MSLVIGDWLAIFSTMTFILPPLFTFLLATALHIIVVAVSSLRPHGLQHARLPCHSLYPRVCSNSCAFSWWCHPTTSSSVTSFSHLQSFLASRSFPVSQFFASGGQSLEASALAWVLSANIQSWFSLELTGLIFLLCKGLSNIFSSTAIWKHQWAEFGKS